MAAVSCRFMVVGESVLFYVHQRCCGRISAALSKIFCNFLGGDFASCILSHGITSLRVL